MFMTLPGDAVKMHVTTTTKMPMATKSKRKPLTVRRIPTELTIERVAPKLLLTTPQRVKKSTSDIPIKYEIVDNNEPPPSEGSTKSEFQVSAEIVPSYIVQGGIKEEQNNRFIDTVKIDNLNQVEVPNVSMNHRDHLSQRAYRERLREDPERYANTRKRERERQKRSRQQKREELYLPGNEMELERQRCNARMRQRRYREKLKILKARQSGLAMQKT
ncbi:unnamed protein product [Owenia fusiformis]|uniref:Uncharacterized protein n=1 Tax=Owenia fusiformis TaxID=6347 RepID=A0A8J1XM70_OWEFU|nr:unnamed protein product [Owenia fusiformis]